MNKTNIIFNKHIVDNVYHMRVKSNDMPKPGQFYMLRAWENYPLLNRPISVYDAGEDYIDFLYIVVGEGSKLLSLCKDGDSINIQGPLGNGFNIEKKYGKVALISGGIGIAPLYYLSKKLNCDSIELYAGFRDKPYATDKFDNCIINIASETGNYGVKGYVSELLKQKKFDTIFICGPNIMMNSISNMNLSDECYISMEAHMGCGIGACLGCQVETKDRGILRICKDGPVFLASEVVCKE